MVWRISERVITLRERLPARLRKTRGMPTIPLGLSELSLPP